MQWDRLGRTGLVVSRLGLGMMSIGDTGRRAWHLTAEQAEPLVRHAVEAGITLFDTADMYDLGASEEATGTLLRRLFAHRDDYVLATKVYFPLREGVTNAGGLSRKHVLSAIDGSLRRLGVDHVDLYQIHRYDPLTPIEETMQALDEVVRAGKARYLGVSAMYAWQFVQAQERARASGWTPFVSMQNHYNLAYREEEREMLPYCRETGVGVLPFSPLAPRPAHRHPPPRRPDGDRPRPVRPARRRDVRRGRLRRRRRAGGRGGRARAAAGPGRVGLAVQPAGRDRADRRRDEDRACRRRDRLARRHAGPGRGCPAGGAVPAASGARSRVSDGSAA
jgi:aryl-alcohol dehydrogenase-like predicted oxidoreductase